MGGTESERSSDWHCTWLGGRGDDLSAVASRLDGIVPCPTAAKREVSAWALLAPGWALHCCPDEACHPACCLMLPPPCAPACAALQQRYDGCRRPRAPSSRPSRLPLTTAAGSSRRCCCGRDRLQQWSSLCTPPPPPPFPQFVATTSRSCLLTVLLTLLHCSRSLPALTPGCACTAAP